MNGLKEHCLFLVRSNKNNQNVRDTSWVSLRIVSFYKDITNMSYAIRYLHFISIDL